MAVNYIKQFKSDLPGPGSYNVLKCKAVIGRAAPAYSFGQKHKNLEEVTGYPSPLYYSPEKSSKFIDTSIKDVVFHNRHFSKETERSPGPAYYSPQIVRTKSITKFTIEPRACLRSKDNELPAPNLYYPDDGYQLIEVKDTKDIRFKKSDRFGKMNNNNVPGPGRYRPDSAERVLHATSKGFHFSRDTRFRNRDFSNKAFGYTILGSAEKIVRKSRYSRPYAQ